MIGQRVIIAALGLLLSAHVSAQQKEALFAANSPQIRYVGRVLEAENGDVSFDWSGVYMTTRFSGERIAVKVSDSKKSYYNVFIDDSLHSVVTFSGRDTVVTLASGLKGREHLLRLQKRSESEQGKTTIHSVILAPKGTLTGVPGKGRMIEFIGNSLTCGYGTEGKSADEPFKVETENCDKAFGCIISRYFDADYALVSHSGRGVARNYGDSLRTSKGTMRERMMYRINEDATAWDFKGYKPDLVVINLGTNDFSTKPHPSREEFTASYNKIIEQIRNGYGDVDILCVAPRVNEPAFTYVRDVTQSCNDKKVHFAALLPGFHNDTSDLGSSAHPNYTGQRKMAMVLIPYISSITGWPLSDSSFL